MSHRISLRWLLLFFIKSSFVLLIVLLSGCGGSESPKVTPTFSAEVPTLTTPPVLEGSVVYQSSENGAFQVFIVDLVKGEIKQLTTEGKNIEPSFSPDGKQIAYGCDKGQKYEICVMNADGSNQRQLTHNTFNDWSPDWSPDGSHLVYVSSEVQYAHLTLLNINTGEINRIATKEGNEGSPEWSPDGSRILFMSDRGGYFNLFTIGPDGTDEVQVTNFGNDDRASWSPDGKKIVLRRQITESSVFSGAEIVIINADGSDDLQLTNDIFIEDWPTFSPNGRWILYSAELGSNMQLIVVPVDGGLAAPLVSGGVFGSAPEWKP